MKSSVSVLFVCLGNICRSPTAEAVFRSQAEASGLMVEIDSAGTIGYHQGTPPDPRSRHAGEARGYSFSGQTSRPVTAEDFEHFDYILAMDKSNLADLLKICPKSYQHKVKLFLDFADGETQEVPDPYYSDGNGFELVLDLVEQATYGLIRQIKE